MAKLTSGPGWGGNVTVSEPTIFQPHGGDVEMRTDATEFGVRLTDDRAVIITPPNGGTRAVSFRSLDGRAVPVHYQVVG